MHKYIKYVERSLLRLNYLKEKKKHLTNFNDTDYINIYKEYSALKKLASINIYYNRLLSDINSVENLLLDSDTEIIKLAMDELTLLIQKKERCENNINKFFIIDHKSNINNIFLEIRAATGGNESAIFAEDLYKMYKTFFNNNKYKTNLMSFSNGNCGGYKEIIIRVSGKNIFDKLQFESGIHRVQRIPKTESNGRIHTSTCSVAILPEIETITSIDLNPSDLRIDTYRASGAGGQHVNVTDSAVRIIHMPSGIVAECQSERSQHKNKQKALSLLASRILAMEKITQKKDIDTKRKHLVGTGSRAEKIRTYNFIENRVTDHRVNITLYKLSDIMDGQLNILIDKLNVNQI